ncbi:MAG: DNA replication/repair protein RecF [Candidatus Zixiibacteriota bacterium]
MFLNNLQIENFRNFEKINLDFSDTINIFYGKNGSGKTNILEAIFIILLTRSFRGAADSIIVNDHSDYYRLEGNITAYERPHQLASVYQKNSRKKIEINRVASRPSDLFDLCAAVSASPIDIEILSGSPSKRRDFINIYLAQASGRYLSDLSDYQKVLAHKNAYLKQNRNGRDNPYDDLLVKYGVSIMLARRKFLDSISISTIEYYRKISADHNLRIEYKPSVAIDHDDWNEDVIEKAFWDKLNHNREREMILQTAMVGPHRDEVEVYIRDYPARSHGSQGELRSAAISLKLGVYDYLSKIKNCRPVLLLDEIFAELDPGRQEMLVEIFSGFGQIFITTASRIPESLESRAKKFEIDNGTVLMQ